MDNNLLSSLPTSSLFVFLGFLLVLSAFFSASETGMTSINPYRLKNLAKTKKNAQRVINLRKRPDKLLAIILIGNNFVNIFASAIATIIGIRLYGDFGVLIATFCLTIVILLFAEITPKTLAVIKPEKIALPASIPIQILSYLLFPFVYIANNLSNSILSSIGVNSHSKNHLLSKEELQIIINESQSLIPSKNQSMISSILELEKISVDDIMVPRNDVVGIDLTDDNDQIREQLRHMHHTLVPVFDGDLNQTKGVLHMRSLIKDLSQEKPDKLDKDSLLKIMTQPYFIPENTSLDTQLVNFQKNKSRLAFVVDEYGDVLGLVTLEDILEEIVGEYTTNLSESHEEIIKQKNGSYIIDGSINLRDLNKTMNWNIPSIEARTLSGAIIEYLETIPEAKTGVQISNYYIEILQLQDNIIKSVNIKVVE